MHEATVMELPLGEYWFWLALVSLGCLAAERIAPWRKGQGIFRPQFSQDLFWLVFNGYIFAAICSSAQSFVRASLNTAFGAVAGRPATAFRLLSQAPLWGQVLVYLVLSDFVEWCVHNLLHRIGWLWKIHRVHHSITTMDWIGNFRFHWGETVLYNVVKYLPLALLGARWEAILATAVISTAIGHLNHSNLNISWGPLRYVLNSPRMHIWHHEKKLRGRAGVNFAVVLSLWDWLLRTAYMPRQALQPEAIGFGGQEKVPEGLLARFLVPFLDRRSA
jgi:sterol desaturase/sphingolipid hydroxylase (fatty acid hydroxylase superfamily)